MVGDWEFKEPKGPKGPSRLGAPVAQRVAAVGTLMLVKSASDGFAQFLLHCGLKRLKKQDHPRISSSPTTVSASGGSSRNLLDQKDAASPSTLCRAATGISFDSYAKDPTGVRRFHPTHCKW